VTPLREYPVRFAWSLVDLYDELTDSAAGQKPLPAKLPSCMETFQAMQKSEKQISGLKWAKLGEVYSYLRHGKRLQIPAPWKKFLPKQPPLEAET